MNPFPIYLLLGLGIVTSLAQSQEFIDNYDMHGDYAKHVYRVEGVRVWNQHENGYEVRGWGARETGKEGTLVLRYVFDKPIVRCSLRAYLLAWFDETDRVSLAVSKDDENYVELTNSSLVPEYVKPYRQRVLDLTPHVEGSKQVFIRIRLRGTKLNTHIMTAEFLRTGEGVGAFQAPHQFEFRATLSDE